MSFQDRPDREGPSQRRLEIGVSLAFALAGATVVIGSLQVGIGWGAEGPRSGFFPFYVGLAILLASAVNLVAARSTPIIRRFATWTELGQVWSVTWPTTLYVLALPLSGIYLASVALIAYFMVRLGGYRPITALCVAVPVLAALYLLFEIWFLVPLPKGPIEELLGL